MAALRERMDDAVMGKPNKQEQQKVQEFIRLLRAHPHGLTCRQIKSKLVISDSALNRILYYAVDLPIGYDSRLDNKYYWIGL